MGVAESLAGEVLQGLLRGHAVDLALVRGVALQHEHVPHGCAPDDGTLPCYPSHVPDAAALVVEPDLLDQGPVLLPDVADVGVDVAVLLGTLDSGPSASEGHEVPVVRDQVGVIHPEKAPGLCGLAGLGWRYERHAGTVDVQGGAVDREYAVAVLQDVAGHSEGDALDPAVVVEIKQEHGERLQVVLGVEVRVGIVKTVDPGMGPDRVGHVVEVVLPHVHVVAVGRVELHADSVYVRLRRVEVHSRTAVAELRRPLRIDLDDSVGHVLPGSSTSTYLVLGRYQLHVGIQHRRSQDRR